MAQFAGVRSQPLNRFQNLGYETVFSYYVSLLNDSSIRNAWKNFSDEVTIFVSVHAVNPELFRQVTGKDCLSQFDAVLLFWPMRSLERSC